MGKGEIQERNRPAHLRPKSEILHSRQQLLLHARTATKAVTPMDSPWSWYEWDGWVWAWGRSKEERFETVWFRQTVTKVRRHTVGN